MSKFSLRDYFVKVLNGMALGLFSSLIIGLILKQLGALLALSTLTEFGNMAQRLMAPAIGASVAFSIGAPGIVIVACMIAGALGGGAVAHVDGKVLLSIGEPVGAFVSALVAGELGKLCFGKTKVDIIIVPAIVIFVGGIIGIYASPVIANFMNYIGELINFATKQQPFFMGLIISVVMGIALTMPISSAAIGISLNLGGLAAGAAVVGGASHMLAFAVVSFRDNGFSGLISQGLGTSMIQISNIIKKPLIMLPAIITSAILGPVSTCIFKLESSAVGSGMGTSGLVGPLSTLTVMGNADLWKILFVQIGLPIVISLLIASVMRKLGFIKPGDMKLK